MEACGINFFYLRAVFPLTLMLATASAQVCVPLGHSSLYFNFEPVEVKFDMANPSLGKPKQVARQKNLLTEHTRAFSGTIS